MEYEDAELEMNRNMEIFFSNKKHLDCQQNREIFRAGFYSAHKGKIFTTKHKLSGSLAPTAIPMSGSFYPNKTP